MQHCRHLRMVVIAARCHGRKMKIVGVRMGGKKSTLTLEVSIEVDPRRGSLLQLAKGK